MAEATVLLVPGSASSPSFVRRAFAPLVADRPVRALTHPSGSAEALADAVAAQLQLGPVAGLIGVSLGAHAAIVALARTGWRDGFAVAALPAWTGAPGPIAAATAAAAELIEQRGLAAELERLQRDFGDDWVTEELLAAWSVMPQTALVTALRGTAASRGPTFDELSAVAAPTAVLALADDPLHPAEVARQWSDVLVRSAYAQVGRSAPAADRTAFGRAAMAALARIA